MSAGSTVTASEVWVIDACALIQVKHEIAPHLQWGFLERLKGMVMSGAVCFPRAVRNELQQARFIDTPEAWALDVCGQVQHCYDPADDVLARVMAVAGDVIDSEAEGDPADPYVLAQAVELLDAGRTVCVVTNDLIDRKPIKIAMSTACIRLGLPWCDLAGFMSSLGFDPKKGWPQPPTS